MNWTLLVYYQMSYGLWLSSPICMVSYLYIGVLELKCTIGYFLVNRLNWNNVAQYQHLEVWATVYFFLFWKMLIIMCSMCFPWHYSLLGKLSFLYFLQGFAPKLLDWSHLCIHWQPNWLAIPVSSSKLWFGSWIHSYSYSWFYLLVSFWTRSFGINALSGKLPVELGKLTNLRSL